MVKFFYFEKFLKEPDILHGISTRNMGFSKPPFDTLNLSYMVGDQKEHVNENRALVANNLGLETEKLFFPRQCHTGNVAVVDQETISSNLENTDALVSAQSEIGIGVLAADCIPILFCDPKKKVIAAAHAGWRGTVKNIGINTVEIMQQEFDCHVEEIIVGIGPGISSENYEVGLDVIQELDKILPDAEIFCRKRGNTKKYLVDLQNINKYLLIKSGLLESNIELMPICTYKNHNDFFSARRDGFKTGRFGAIIKINSIN